MRQYLELLQYVREHGQKREDRTGVGTLSSFGHQMRYDLSEGFPLVTTKKIHLKSVIYELLWFVRGDTNVHYLQEHGVRIWNEWASPTGDLGPIYGAQWRHWTDDQGRTHDQLAEALRLIRECPESRRIIVNAWNVGQLDQMRLPPCHMFYQFYVSGGELSLQMYQRSADLFLGVPFNIASYALLLQMVAQVSGLRPRMLVHTIGDAHIYLNHLEQVDLQLSREPRPLPTMHLNPEIRTLEGFDYSDFDLRGYDPHPTISAPVAV